MVLEEVFRCLLPVGEGLIVDCSDPERDAINLVPHPANILGRHREDCETAVALNSVKRAAQRPLVRGSSSRYSFRWASANRRSSAFCDASILYLIQIPTKATTTGVASAAMNFAISKLFHMRRVSVEREAMVVIPHFSQPWILFDARCDLLRTIPSFVAIAPRVGVAKLRRRGGG